MIHLLLVIIYLAFISLGLPDSLLGSAWPSMYKEFNVPVSYAGVIFMIISAGTIVSSLQSERLTRSLGTGKVTALSVLMTAVSLWGFSISRSYWMLILWAIPYGLGAGSVDASLNNYVAIHYKSRHMSWLHCMWGIGASVGPYIIGFGCAPIYPCIIHSTPDNFGADKSQAIIGVQMASAYVGNLLMPPLFGIIANNVTAALLPVYLLVILIIMALMHIKLINIKKEGTVAK